MRLTQDVVSGSVVIVVAAVILTALSEIPATSYQAIPPDLFPRLCAYGMILGGIALLIRGLRASGVVVRLPAWRPVLFVVASVVLFGALTPVIGYAIAGFLTVVIGGLGSREVRLRELVLFAGGLTAFSILLFSVVLKLTIPILILPGFRL